MPRNDLEAYVSGMARIPQDLADAVKQDASQHRMEQGWIQEAVRTPVSEVLQGHPFIPQPHTQGMPALLPLETPSAASPGEGMTVSSVMPSGHGSGGRGGRGAKPHCGRRARTMP